MQNLDHFIEQIDFEVNQFNVGDELYQYLIVLQKYKNWFDYYRDEKSIQIKSEDFFLFFEKLLSENASGHLKKQFREIKEGSEVFFHIHPVSLFKIYLILKVRLYQINDQDADLQEFYKKLQHYFERLQDPIKDSSQKTCTRELPEMNNNTHSTQWVFPMSLSVIAVTFLKIFPATTAIIVLQIAMFVIAGVWFFQIQKKQKTQHDEPYLKNLDLVFAQSLQ